MKKAYIVIAALVMGAGAAYGQDDLNRSVDIAKDYMPRVDRASKLSIRPQMVDTTTLRPQLEYTVHPQAWTGGFEVAPIRAAQMNTGTYNAQYPLYLKAGGGFPGQSVFDLYATSARPGASGFGVYANHRGHYSDIENFDGHKNRATSTANSIGLFGCASFGRLSLSGEVGWDYDLISYYGDRGIILQDGDMETPKSPLQHYSTPRAALLFGHDFTDLSRLNFRLGADGYMLDDRYDRKETGGSAFLELGRRFNVHDLTLRAGVDIWKGGGRNGDAGSTVMSVSPGYGFSAGALLFRMGATFAYETPGEASYGDEMIERNLWFLPQLEFSLTLADGAFNPYARLDSRLTPGSLRSLTAQNPYLSPAEELYSGISASQSDYRMRAGISGSVGGVFSYNLFAGYNIVKNAPEFFYNDTDGFMFRLYKEVKYPSLGAELETRIGNAFSLTLDGHYNGYSKDDPYFHNCLPQYEAGAVVRYNYRDRFIVRVGARVKDGIDFYPQFGPVYDSPDMKSKTTVDVSLAADYFLSDRLGIFLEGRNLAGQDLYPLPFYRGVGMSISAGVKLRF